MNHTIKSRKLGQDFEFILGAGGYVSLKKENGNYSQICKGGQFAGATLEATEDNFVNVCKNWYRSYMTELNKYS